MGIIKTYIKKKVKPVVYANIHQIKNNELFNQKRILIIGGSSGIGYAIAQKIVISGGSVVIAGRNLERLKESQLKLGEKCFALQWDIGQIESSENLLKEANALLGGEVECLVNSAGVWNDDIDYATCTERDWDYMMDINLKGTYFLCQAFARSLLVAKKSGNILIISSERGLYPDDRPYGLSKAALNSYVQALARRLLPNNIRVNALAPGWTATEHGYPKQDGNLYAGGTCGKRMVEPEEIAEVACFLLSDAASCISGAIIPCNHGNHIRSDW